MPADTNGLARFRADPAKVRVSVRRSFTKWRVGVINRETEYEIATYDQGPVRALDEVLVAAARAKMPGIDLGMDWAYDHPMAVKT